MAKVKLRKFRLSDLKQYYKLHANNKVLDNLLPEIKAKDITLGNEKKWLQKNILRYRQKKPEKYHLAITAGGNLVGDARAAIDYSKKSVEIGYWIGEPYWSKGYATDTVKQFIRLLIRKFKPKRIDAYAFSHNKASSRVLEKSGFKFIETRKKNVRKYGRWLDNLIYAIDLR